MLNYTEPDFMMNTSNSENAAGHLVPQSLTPVLIGSDNSFVQEHEKDLRLKQLDILRE